MGEDEISKKMMQNSLLIFYLIWRKMTPYKIDVTSNMPLAQGCLWKLPVSTWLVYETNQTDNLMDLAGRGMSILCVGYAKKDGSGDHDDCQLNITGKATLTDYGPLQAAAREVHEETGMFVPTSTLEPCGRIVNHKRIHDLFRVRASKLSVHRHAPVPAINTKDKQNTRIVCTIYGTRDELIDKAMDMANTLRRPSRNPDDIAYLVVLSAQDALYACQHVLQAPPSARQVEVDFEPNHPPMYPRRRRRDEDQDTNQIKRTRR